MCISDGSVRCGYEECVARMLFVTCIIKGFNIESKELSIETEGV